MSKTVKVDKDYVEKVVKEDLSRKYPDIKELEFQYVLRQYRKDWVAIGVFSTSRGFRKAFMYFIDGETGEVLGFTIS
jgi:hypothetical protein